MRGFQFTQFNPDDNSKSRFEQMLDLFMQLLTYTSGDLSEALQWMNELDKKYQLTDDEYGMGDFIDELKEKGYISGDNEKGEIKIMKTIKVRSYFCDKLKCSIRFIFCSLNSICRF